MPLRVSVHLVWGKENCRVPGKIYITEKNISNIFMICYFVLAAVKDKLYCLFLASKEFCKYFESEHKND